MELLPIKRALLSVTHKDGLDILAAFLHSRGVEIVSTGGTLNYLEKAGLPVTSVSAVTGFPEILGGRVKTLHPFIHGGILADKDNPDHMATLAAHGILPFDLVCVNLYDFDGAVAKHLSFAETIEQIDIGGPCLIRAAAKNCSSLVVLPDPAVYPELIDEMKKNAGSVSLAFRRKMATKAFALTSSYDAKITAWMGKK